MEMLQTIGWLAMLAVMSGLGTTAMAQVSTRAVAYEHDGVQLEGFLAEPEGAAEKLPGVLVVHEWWGLNDYTKKRAQMLAELGYVALAVDMYGKGQVTDDAAQAAKWAGAMYSNPELWRARVRAGLDALLAQDHVDASRIGAIGYCFGGATVQQLAFSGAPVAGVVSFHGSMVQPTEAEAKTATKLLICHGGADSMVPMTDVAAWQAAMEAGGADYQFIIYAGAKHSFTSPQADTRGIPGIGYHPNADRRSWEHMRAFFEELFAR